MGAKILKMAGIGFLAGALVGVFIVVAKGFADGGRIVLPSTLLAATGSEAGALLAHVLLSGVYGTIPMAGTVLYDLDSWGLLKQAVVHYATYTIAFMIVGICAGWIEPTLSDIGLMAGIFAVCHTIIWFIMYTRYKAEAEQLSALLQEAKQSV